MTATDTSSPALDPNDGGETCTYTVVSPEVDSCTFTSPNQLANGDSYTFTVTGTNADGTGAASAPSNSVTPSTVPDAPTNVEASPGNATATVTWSPGFDEGSTTTSYTVTATDTSSPANDPNDGGETCTYTVVAPEVDSCTFTSPNQLANGDSYTFTVTGTNADGTGAASGPSNSVIPAAVPDAPTGVVATAGDQTATVTWTPGFDEGSPTTSYTVTATDTSTPPLDPNDGGETCADLVVSPEVDSCTFTSPNLLANDDSYTFTVTGTNANGTGAASAPSNGVTPSTVPDAPTGVTGFPGNKKVVVTWTPGFDEGSPTTSYAVAATDITHAVNGGETCTYTVVAPEVDSCTVKQLTNGDTYTFTVTATNANGTSAASAASVGVTPTTLVPVSITSADSTGTGVGQAFKFKVTALGSPAPTITISGEPTWVHKSASVAGQPLTLSGTPAASDAGNNSFTIMAANGVAAPVYQTFTISVLRITSGTTAKATARTPFSFEITTSDTPANPTITVTGLPAGLTAGNYSNGDEYITGTPKPSKLTTSKYSVVITASSGPAIVTQKLVITLHS